MEIFSDTSLGQWHSVSINCVMSLSSAVDLELPLNWHHLYFVPSIWIVASTHDFA